MSRQRRIPTPTPAPQGVPAAAQLLTMVLRPEVLQALLAMALGPMGRGDVPVGGTPVPLGAFTNLLSVLSSQAATDYNWAVAGQDEEVPEYLTSESGELMCDVAIPEERARVLLGLLEQADASESEEEDDEPTAMAEWWNGMLLDEGLYEDFDVGELFADSDEEFDEVEAWEEASW